MGMAEMFQHPDQKGSEEFFVDYLSGAFRPSFTQYTSCSMPFHDISATKYCKKCVKNSMLLDASQHGILLHKNDVLLINL